MSAGSQSLERMVLRLVIAIAIGCGVGGFTYWLATTLPIAIAILEGWDFAGSYLRREILKDRSREVSRELQDLWRRSL